MFCFRLLAPLPLLTLATAAAAQFAPAPPRSDADRLAADMRLIAANPDDAAALADAGEASIGVGDLSGAGSLFARAADAWVGGAVYRVAPYDEEWVFV